MYYEHGWYQYRWSTFLTLWLILFFKIIVYTLLCPLLYCVPALYMRTGGDDDAPSSKRSYYQVIMAPCGILGCNYCDYYCYRMKKTLLVYQDVRSIHNVAICSDGIPSAASRTTEMTDSLSVIINIHYLAQFIIIFVNSSD